MPYVDGFVVAVPKEKIEDYKALARRAGRSGRSTERSRLSSALGMMCRMGN